MAFMFTYQLEGAGWAVARIQDGTKFIDATVSYLHDSLRELAEAAIALARGAEHARVVFMDEPGETQLIISRSGQELSFEARWFDDWNSWGMHPAEKFQVVLSGRTTVARFVGEVRKAIEALLEEHGIEGYKAKWIEAEFPKELLADLVRIDADKLC
jgi:hypothetical protein